MQKVAINIPTHIYALIKEYCKVRKTTFSNLVREQVYKCIGLPPESGYMKPGPKNKRRRNEKNG